MAARGQFKVPSRLPALFLTLSATSSTGARSRCCNAGARLSFPGSELVFQLYPGHGLQIQWLGTFGKLNGYWSGGKRYDARAGALLDEALPLATERAGGLAWEYLFPFDGQAPPWVSSLAQGTGLQAMARSATRLQRQAEVFPIADARARHLPDRAARGRARARRRRRPLPAVLRAAEPEDPQRLRPVARRPLRLRRADGRRHRALAVRRRRPRRARRGPDVRHRRVVAVLARIESRTSPTSATTRCCATSSSSCASGRRRSSTAARASTSRTTSRSRR